MFDFERGPFKFSPEDNYIFSPGKITVIGPTYFEDDDEEVKNCKDPKIYLYTTSNNLNFTYTLTVDNGDSFDIDLSAISSVPLVNKYNILFMVSRKVKDDEGLFRGFNYI